MQATRALIVYCHPWSGSFNHAILEAVKSSLARDGVPYDLIDLHADGFQPAYDQKELSLFSKGETNDPLVSKYLGLLKGCDMVIFITPVWWNEIPAMLKGFIDKTMKSGEDKAYTESKFGMHGHLDNIRKAYVITTASAPRFYLRFMAGNGIQGLFMNSTLKQLGIKRSKWIHFGRVTSATPDRRKAYLTQRAEAHYTI
ncbi:NAD(P)H dehydrogenase [Bombiscardovia apis]|uniref:NAD(P)H dehydrogenase n=1 Tax=Bombiscardovia apis TaxID=2932182 RepID=A0ABM8BBI3_9BIFI|nr:NAD(P)H-dependent oxidoreductase [Bombiscardovia apis]BDR53954.1 NAD(P)H dehydrogenase [Bombiscardovia apis]